MNNIGSASYSSSQDYGPWSFIIDDGYITFLQGSVFYTDEMLRLTVDGLNQQLDILKYVLLKIDIDGGYPKKASIFSSQTLFPYRTFKDNQKMIKKQTSLCVPVCVLSGGPGGFFDESSGRTVQKCLHSDVMIYANCDGLIILPAPFSMVPWESPQAAKEN